MCYAPNDFNNVKVIEYHVIMYKIVISRILSVSHPFNRIEMLLLVIHNEIVLKPN